MKNSRMRLFLIVFDITVFLVDLDVNLGGNEFFGYFFRVQE